MLHTKKGLLFKVTKNLPFNILEVLSVFIRLVFGITASKRSKKRSLVRVSRLLSSSTEITSRCFANFLLSIRQQINMINNITVIFNPLSSSTIF